MPRSRVKVRGQRSRSNVWHAAVDIRGLALQRAIRVITSLRCLSVCLLSLGICGKSLGCCISALNVLFFFYELVMHHSRNSDKKKTHVTEMIELDGRNFTTLDLVLIWPRIETSCLWLV